MLFILTMGGCDGSASVPLPQVGTEVIRRGCTKTLLGVMC